jgi:hypothetical protein
VERHGSESYFVLGEGLLGETVGGRTRTLARTVEATVPPFRFSRMGPGGGGLQLGDATLGRLGTAMSAGGGGSSQIPAGFTYLGQFVDHDLTFDKSRLRDDATVPVADLVQGRSPSLDLDSLYGLGPDLTPEFYAADKVHLLTGTTTASGPNDGFSENDNPGFDLPRTSGAQQNTLIPDARNDENLAVGQTHLAFIRFHNRVVDKLAAEGVPAADRFATARGLVVRHYQWMLRTDFLPRITNKPQLKGVFDNGRVVVEPNPPAGDAPTMPVEFSVAAYRLGHSMVRPAYEWNGVFEDGEGTLELLFAFSGTSGGLDANNTLPSNWVADWRGLYTFPSARPDLQPRRHGKLRRNPARRIDTRLTNPLANLFPETLGEANPSAARRNLAFRNLTRARMLQLATGQQMAAHMRSKGLTNIKTLTRTQILNGDGKGADLGGLNAPQRDALAKDTPLWFYALREAELNNGRMTGVGGRLVAETFHRAMEGSVISILGEPAWRPTLGPVANRFTMVDLLTFAFQGNRNLLAPVRGSLPE